MSRAEMRRQLDGAVGESRVTLVHGLPRVGRSELVRRWAGSRDDAALQPFASQGVDIAPVMVFDHLKGEEADAFIARFRAAEEAQARTRFVVVPVDLAAGERIRDALAGSVLTLEVVPLQLDDLAAEQPMRSTAAGPSIEAVAEPVPSNAPSHDRDRHWLRGGLPESLAADNDRASLGWRRGMIETLPARDYTRWDVPRASRLPEILRWVANQQGGELDDTACPVAKKGELRSALYVLERLGVTRRLPNFPAGSSSSLGKKPKLYIRDNGILHAMLGVGTIDQLRNHMLAGESWEGYAIEALILAVDERCSAQFYRARGIEGDDEIDLVLDCMGHCGRRIAIECKLSPDQKARAGFYRACEEIGATDRFVVHSGSQVMLASPIDRLDLTSAIRRVREIVRSG